MEDVNFLFRILGLFALGMVLFLILLHFDNLNEIIKNIIIIGLGFIIGSGLYRIYLYMVS